MHTCVCGADTRIKEFAKPCNPLCHQIALSTNQDAYRWIARMDSFTMMCHNSSYEAIMELISGNTIKPVPIYNTMYVHDYCSIEWIIYQFDVVIL